jgi:negative regulator of sigma E activity
MSPNTVSRPDDFREQLSAWRDGALPDEAARFVLKRLLQDDALRAEVGRWQVIGDALRSQAQQRPSSDIAARVAEAIDKAGRDELASDAVAATAAVTGSRAVARRPAVRWMATAAAVGMAAVLMWPSAPEPGADAALAIAATPLEPTPSPAASTANVASTSNVAAVPTTSQAFSTPRPAPVQLASSRNLPVPLRMDESRGVDALAIEVPPLVRAPQPTPEQLAPLPAGEVPSRPWPRSAQAQGAYTVEYAAPTGTPPRQ